MSADIDFAIDPDIRRARAMPASIYTSSAAFERQRQRVFPRTWHLHPGDVPSSTGFVPWTLLPGCLDEPMLLARRPGGDLDGLSNVCTHRGALLLDRPAPLTSIRCPYHGRRFDPRGRVLHAPGFETCPGFPEPRDHLAALATGVWGPLAFASLEPAEGFDEWIAPLQGRVRALLDRPLLHAPEHRRTFSVPANWALYCDNYLEGLHIPFVHPRLHRTLEFSGYRTTLLSHAVLQTAVAAPNEPYFIWPKSHPDHDLRIAAYYYWLFPTTMVNIYPWGLSLNAVCPRGPDHTDVVFFRYVWDATLEEHGAGSGLDDVEAEDEAIIARAFAGLRAQRYPGGRYAPEHECGVHHFHRLLAQAMARPRDA